MKVEQKQRKMKKCSTAESEINPCGAKSRTKTEKNENVFYRRVRNQSSPNLCVKYFSQAQVVQGMRMHPCLSTITLEGAVKGAPSAHLEEVPLTAPERVIHLTQLLVFVVPLPIF